MIERYGGSPAGKIDISVIIVNWNTRDLLRDFPYERDEGLNGCAVHTRIVHALRSRRFIFNTLVTPCTHSGLLRP